MIHLYYSGSLANLKTGGHMLKGKVSWFNDLRGYGFIASKDLPESIFVRFLDICAPGYRTLKKGDEVVFEVARSPVGVHATNVTKM
jgi:cold shock protein